MKKIDIHSHVTNRRIENLSYSDCSISGLLEEMDKHEVEKAVVMASYFPHKSSGISNFRLHSWIKKNPRFLLFGSLDFENYFYQGINELEELADLGKLRGIKLYTTYQKIDLKSEKFGKVIDLAREYSLPLAFHTGYSYSLRRNEGRDSVEGMVKASDLEFIAVENPDINILACHMSKPFLDDVIKVVKRNHNFYTDVSGLLDSKYGSWEVPELIDEVKRFVEECGHTRLLFGTDFPVQTYEDSIRIVEEALKDFPKSVLEDIYYNNARRFLKWD